jgi:outer membrane receptor for ferrienterochelin and colicin
MRVGHIKHQPVGPAFPGNSDFSDALGGVINIVTNKQKRNWFLDANNVPQKKYSYTFNRFTTYVT